ncbi:class I SAM-dependent methyltransferase [Aetokthonos hydrillicola Thurmond2011]|jgi:ubiquinone/menaquinone biosynthesis C-methylase UbiE|uniref:Class I SAM-dependent methyltransferase n=1 Tax=Aetokthonos hydrillicola Thurmond2011 TaxID=2712845 RepID=A0AAP5MAH2_9CYAN|nr:class I SAM-dependent methyltransferase [Aetokthonos hydrillicola]MBO3461244.1 class I SAM-dependent methyltransferase [Aetokthonos hydrillicola CCALA 1050]MBW4583710.1 class I SAM-dependent methyltransferase [Aetokthonos hydrillicola CCALA 1050]MDR9895594.1 class I SAM-dependent methyltransferase [Aetokthonos hydrillicola Thurmond2011]WJI96267.1 AesH [Aetokthonos hydrillicola Thurmond2011]
MQENKSVGASQLTDPVKDTVKTFYNSINDHLNTSGFGEYSTFLNWGYVSDGSPDFSKVELPERCLNKNCLKLILEVVGDCDLTGRDILEVGCGRGGNIQTLDKFFKPKGLTGIDITPASIAFCKKYLETERRRFLEGDAEALPFENETFDVVINVESSNAYPNLFNFYSHVSRVLKPGGYFLYTDLIKTELIEDCIQYLAKCGLVLEINRDITSNVLLSRQETAATQMKSFGFQKSEVAMSNEEKKIFDFFLAPEGTTFFEQIQDGRFSYNIFRFRKKRE